MKKETSSTFPAPSLTSNTLPTQITASPLKTNSNTNCKRNGSNIVAAMVPSTKNFVMAVFGFAPSSKCAREPAGRPCLKTLMLTPFDSPNLRSMIGDVQSWN
jgi:hypothetical protein